MDLDIFNVENNGVVTPKHDLFIQTKLTFIQNENYDVYQKIVYQLLYTYGIDKRGVYPSHARIAQQLGLSKRKVVNVINELESKNGLYIVRRMYKDSKQKATNLYYLADIDKNGNFDDKCFDVLKRVYPNKTDIIDKL